MTKRGRRWLMPLICALAVLCACAAAQRPRKKMIEALAAIDVGSGVEEIKHRASLPWATSKVLVYTGARANYADFCALSGWSAMFRYELDKQWVASGRLEGSPWGDCLARGVGHYGRRLETFTWPRGGEEEERAMWARAAWEFVLEHIAADRPVLTDYLSGGVFYGYDETATDPAVYFDTLGPGFGALRRSKFLEAFGHELMGLGVIGADEPGPGGDVLMTGTLLNLLVRAHESEAGDCTEGVAGMQSLAADLLEPARDWKAGAPWLDDGLVAMQAEARLCTAVYLKRNATVLGDKAAPHLTAAAECYAEAFRLWQQALDATALTQGRKDTRPLAERLSDPGRRENVAGYVHQALGAELRALAQVRQALEITKEATPGR